MPLGVAKIALAVVIVALVIGFVVPEAYEGISDAGDVVGDTFLDGLPVALFGLVIVGIVMVIGVIILRGVNLA